MSEMTPAEYREMMAKKNAEAAKADEGQEVKVEESQAVIDPTAGEIEQDAKLAREHTNALEELKEEIVEEEKGEIEEITDTSNVNETVDKLMNDFEKSMEGAPIITDEVGSLDKIKSVDTLKKMGYYAVFGHKDHEADCVGDAVKGANLARFETKAQLKQVVAKLAEHNYKLLDIIKGRPISYEITTRKISEVTIGD